MRFPGHRRMLAVVAAATLACGAGAAVTYRRYAAVHLRDLPKLPSCVWQARSALRKPAAVSGTEPREAATGETVYLTPREDAAVACAFLIDERLSRRLAGALAEQEPSLRATALLQLARDGVSPAPADDRVALASMMFAGAALRALPEDVAAVRAATTDVELLQACRFDTRRRCPTRPPIPLLVWIAAAPAALGAVVLGASGARALAARLRVWMQRRRARRQAPPGERAERAALSADSTTE